MSWQPGAGYELRGPKVLGASRGCTLLRDLNPVGTWFHRPTDIADSFRSNQPENSDGMGYQCEHQELLRWRLPTRSTCPGWGYVHSINRTCTARGFYQNWGRRRLAARAQNCDALTPCLLSGQVSVLFLWTLSTIEYWVISGIRGARVVACALSPFVSSIGEWCPPLESALEKWLLVHSSRGCPGPCAPHHPLNKHSVNTSCSSSLTVAGGCPRSLQRPVVCGLGHKSRLKILSGSLPLVGWLRAPLPFACAAPGAAVGRVSFLALFEVLCCNGPFLLVGSISQRTSPTTEQRRLTLCPNPRSGPLLLFALDAPILTGAPGPLSRGCSGLGCCHPHSVRQTRFFKTKNKKVGACPLSKCKKEESNRSHPRYRVSSHSRAGDREENPRQLAAARVGGPGPTRRQPTCPPAAHVRGPPPENQRPMGAVEAAPPGETPVRASRGPHKGHACAQCVPQTRAPSCSHWALWWSAAPVCSREGGAPPPPPIPPSSCRAATRVRVASWLTSAGVARHGRRASRPHTERYGGVAPSPGTSQVVCPRRPPTHGGWRRPRPRRRARRGGGWGFGPPRATSGCHRPACTWSTPLSRLSPPPTRRSCSPLSALQH